MPHRRVWKMSGEAPSWAFPPRAKISGAFFDSARQLDADGAFSEIELERDLGGVETVEDRELDNGAAPTGEGVQSGSHQFEPLLVVREFRSIGGIVQEDNFGQSVYGNRPRLAASFAEDGDGTVRRERVEIGFEALDLAQRLHSEEAQVGFLDDVVGIEGGKPVA